METWTKNGVTCRLWKEDGMWYWETRWMNGFRWGVASTKRQAISDAKALGRA